MNGTAGALKRFLNRVGVWEDGGMGGLQLSIVNDEWLIVNEDDH